MNFVLGLVHFFFDKGLIFKVPKMLHLVSFQIMVVNAFMRPSKAEDLR